MDKRTLRRTLDSLHVTLHGVSEDTEATKRCADYLYWALRIPPTYAPQQERQVAAYRGYIERSRCDPAKIGRCLTLALSRYSGGSEADCEALVAAMGVDGILATLALPIDDREAFLSGEPLPGTGALAVIEVPERLRSGPEVSEAIDEATAPRERSFR